MSLDKILLMHPFQPGQLHPFRSAEDLLADFKGYVMCDGFSAYESLAKAYPENPRAELRL